TRPGLEPGPYGYRSSALLFATEFSAWLIRAPKN
uniref:Uncharacterized protein n=1 Tax=Acrobeloides nanus TaxID=290746 RepID=A0A914CNS9_9BILA